MELKNYQRDVISDLKNFLNNLNQLGSVKKAYNQLWEDKQVVIGDKIKEYQATIPNTPHVCFKVPTGGGKTLLACASIKPIFDALTFQKTNVVVWLVPSDAILRQTLNHLKDVSHDYRQYIDVDFKGRVNVYSKEEALQGQNFSPSAIRDNLCIFVFSYDSIRTSNQEGRKVYQQNGALESFRDNSLYDGYHVQYGVNEDKPSLMGVLRSFEPVVIVDESHNAQTELSLAMIKSFNPSFVLDLTATPRENSNIISIVGAYRLKKAHMVKLPVIVKNQSTVAETIQMAINMQNILEKAALEEEQDMGRYIRPIVLFQAESRVSEESTDFQRIKEKLVSFGIPEEQIAIKTACINELCVAGKDIDLLDKGCPIRFIITVNALKEGWDCPFAYVLASLANKSSVVDVEQIVGRILRLPNVHENKHKLLNNSYVFTCSSQFNETIKNVVKGLNNAGFSSKDYRATNYAEPAPTNDNVQTGMFTEDELDAAQRPNNVSNGFINPGTVTVEFTSGYSGLEDFLSVDTEHDISDNGLVNMDEFLSSVERQSDEYTDEVNQEEGNTFDLPNEIISNTSIVRVKDEFLADLDIGLPKCCFYEEETSFENEIIEEVSKEDLIVGFRLGVQNVEVDFANIQSEMYKIDVEDGDDDVPKRSIMTANEQNQFKKLLNDMPSENKKGELKKKLREYLNGKYNSLHYDEIISYVDRLVESLSTEQIGDFTENYLSYQDRIENKIEVLLEEYRKRQFIAKLRSQEIIVKFDRFRFKEQAIVKDNRNDIAKSLYTGEGNMDDLEVRFIEKVAGLDNVKWWHRNGQNEKDKNAFCLNGYINHYPDFVIMTKKGHMICAETKGDQYNRDVAQLNKAQLGYLVDTNDNNPNFSYFMIFKNLPEQHDGCITEQEFFEIIKQW